jgi:hypothetical protein
VKIACLALLFAFACHSSKSAPRDGGVDAAAACEASGGCAAGPRCGITCCGAGEQCVAGACMCGTSAPCNTASTGDTCQSAGPILSSCGRICCGGSHICPVRQ